MADILKLITETDRIDYGTNYAYKTNFMGQKLFPAKKVENLKVRIAQLLEGGDVPVMAQVHSFDSEARIGDRPDFDVVDLEQAFIKEKINQTERIIKLLGNRATENETIDFVYNDMDNMMSRVLTRCEVANMELLSTGKVTYKENNVNLELDYKLSSDNKVALGKWSDSAHDILGDINTIISRATAKGVTLARAITTSKVIGYMINNDGIKGFWANKADVLTKARLITWLNENYGIEFVTNDEVYKESAKSTVTHRFFKEDTISFVGTKATLGEGLFGVTPEELELNDGKYEFNEKMFVALTQWKTPDPVAVWTKASALYVPVIKNINGLFIGTVS